MKDSKDGDPIDATAFEASRWLTRLERGDDDPLEFDQWLRQRPSHAREFLENACIDHELMNLEFADELSVADRVKQIRIIVARKSRSSVIHLASLATHASPTGRVLSRVPWTRILTLAGAGVLVLSLLAALWWHEGNGRDYSTGAGDWRRIELTDGSVVQLNSRSAIRVRYTSRARNIRLIRGEALFTVTRDPARPFRVQSNGAVVQALGTEFDVRAYDEFEVLVTRGRVAVALDREHSIAPLTLSAGQAVTVQRQDRASAVEVRELTAQERRQALDWSIRTIGVADVSLHDLVERFNRYNRTQLIIDDPEIADMRLGGQFHLSNPHQFASALEQLGLHAQPDSDGDGRIHLSRPLRSETGVTSAAGLQPNE